MSRGCPWGGSKTCLIDFAIVSARRQLTHASRSPMSRTLFALPSRLDLDRSSDSIASLTAINVSASPGLANALLLTGHPMRTALPTEALTRWSLARLEMELRGRRRSSCGAQVHSLRPEGTVHYHKSTQRLPCRALLKALRSREARAYGVDNLEETSGAERCLS